MMRICRWEKSGCGPVVVAVDITVWSRSKQHLGSREYARLRIGIGRKDSRREIAGHVLGKI
ncbi:MAG: hypothetical protein QM813_08560 [Verrucomicrobiota bacterium]